MSGGAPPCLRCSRPSFSSSASSVSGCMCTRSYCPNAESEGLLALTRLPQAGARYLPLSVDDPGRRHEESDICGHLADVSSEHDADGTIW